MSGSVEWWMVDPEAGLPLRAEEYTKPNGEVWLRWVERYEDSGKRWASIVADLGERFLIVNHGFLNRKVTSQHFWPLEHPLGRWACEQCGWDARQAPSCVCGWLDRPDVLARRWVQRDRVREAVR